MVLFAAELGLNSVRHTVLVAFCWRVPLGDCSCGGVQALHDGESYELCLTTALECQQPVDAFELYRTLRRVNPAPYAAWLSFSGGPQVCPRHPPAHQM